MIYFVTYTEENELKCHRFFTVDLLFKWLQNYISENGEYPEDLCFYKADCLFDGS